MYIILTEKKAAGEMGKCEMCGKVDLKARFKKNKRFCSSTCSKGMKAANQQQQQHQQQQVQINSNSFSPGNNVNNDSSNKLKHKTRKYVSSFEISYDIDPFNIIYYVNTK